jgi:hypothetical protein
LKSLISLSPCPFSLIFLRGRDESCFRDEGTARRRDNDIQLFLSATLFPLSNHMTMIGNELLLIFLLGMVAKPGYEVSRRRGISTRLGHEKAGHGSEDRGRGTQPS